MCVETGVSVWTGKKGSGACVHVRRSGSSSMSMQMNAKGGQGIRDIIIKNVLRLEGCAEN